VVVHPGGGIRQIARAVSGRPPINSSVGQLIERNRRNRKAAPPADPELFLSEMTEFVNLARDGAYMAGDRRVSRTERSK
jgi:hypothetical protein